MEIYKKTQLFQFHDHHDYDGIAEEVQLLTADSSNLYSL
jgi:hypothetical protein